MRRFIDTVTDRTVADELRGCIQTATAFRDFNKIIRRHRMENDWLIFRRKANERVAIEWCDEHNLAYE